MKIVIFACVHNAGRSQMAATLFNKYVKPQKARAISAGTEPAKQVHSEVVSVMKELGMDLSLAIPTYFSLELTQSANLLVTMCCGEKCPFVPGLERKDWPITDPKAKSLEEVRRIRDQIKDLVIALLKEKSWLNPNELLTIS